ncbi:MAG: WG repeat-containing protein [Sediminibacterium sp.]|nr:WG repeat-containing protein [Sediminibacterium sp.]
MQKIEGTYHPQTQTFDSIDKSYWTGTFTDSIAHISKNGLIGLMNQKGKIIIEPKYDRIFKFYNGIAIVSKNNQYGFVNSKGQEIVAPTFHFIFDFEDSDITWFYKKENGHHSEGLINKKGQIIATPEKTVFRKINNQYLATTTVGHTLLSGKGEPLLKIDYKSFNGLEKNHPFVVNMDPWLSYSESDKTENIKRADYLSETLTKVPIELPFFFSEGSAILPKNVNGVLKLGYINTEGKELIPANYNQAQLFKHGKAAVMQNNKWGIINTKGETILPFRYDYLEVLNENYFLFKANEKLGILDISQTVILKADYSAIQHITGDVFAVLPYTASLNKILKTLGTELNSQINNWGCINVKTGQQILAFDYHAIKKLSATTGLGIKFSFEAVKNNDKDPIQAHIQNSTAVSYNDYLIFTKQSVFDQKQVLFNYTSEPELQANVQQAVLKTNEELKAIHLLIEQLFFYNNKLFLTKQGEKVTATSILKQLELKTYSSHLRIIKDETTSKIGVKTLDDELIINTEYDNITICHSGMILCKNKKFGFADLTGKLLIPLIYDNLSELPSGCLETIVNYKSQLIDKTGKPLTD